MWSDCHLSGNMPPIVTEPTVIRCKVNSTVTIKFVAQDPNGDPITYSLPYPRPPGASISSGETHTQTFVPPTLNQREPPPPPSMLQMMLRLTFVSGTVSQQLRLSAELSQWMGHTERETCAGVQHARNTGSRGVKRLETRILYARKSPRLKMYLVTSKNRDLCLGGGDIMSLLN